MYLTKITHLHIYIHWNTVKHCFSVVKHIIQQTHFQDACYSRQNAIACKRKCSVFSYTSCIFTVGNLSCSVHLFTVLSTVLHHQIDTKIKKKKQHKLNQPFSDRHIHAHTHSHTRTQAYKHLSAFFSFLQSFIISSVPV